MPSQKGLLETVSSYGVGFVFNFHDSTNAVENIADALFDLRAYPSLRILALTLSLLSHLIRMGSPQCVSFTSSSLVPVERLWWMVGWDGMGLYLMLFLAILSHFLTEDRVLVATRVPHMNASERLGNRIREWFKPVLYELSYWSRLSFSRIPRC